MMTLMSGLAVAGGDDTLQILVVVIRRHVVGIAFML